MSDPFDDYEAELLQLQEENRRLKAALDLICKVSTRQRIAVSLTKVRPCSAPDCPKPARARGKCWTHYKRWQVASREAVAA